MVYTLVESARANNPDVFQYLKYLLTEIPNGQYLEHPEILDQYLPWSAMLPEECRLERNHQMCLEQKFKQVLKNIYYDNTRKISDKSSEYQSPSSPDKEYEMMRTEILQYMEEYQTVRNMMYIVTAMILGLNSALLQNYYLFLLPLIVILPSYMVFYNYWKAVSCASTYIQVFLDNEHIQTTYRWELRHRYFSALYERTQNRPGDKLRNLDMHSQQIPYLVCGCLCVVLYWINLLWKYASPYIKETVGETLSKILLAIRIHFFTFKGYHLMSTWHVVLDILLGIVSIVLIGVFFKTFWNMQSVEMTKTWERIRNFDLQQEEDMRRNLGLHSVVNSRKDENR